MKRVSKKMAKLISDFEILVTTMMREDLRSLVALFNALVFSLVDKLPVTRARRAITTLVSVVIILVIIIAGAAIVVVIILSSGPTGTTTITSYP